jgi:hypothetical protein
MKALSLIILMSLFTSFNAKAQSQESENVAVGIYRCSDTIIATLIGDFNQRINAYTGGELEVFLENGDGQVSQFGALKIRPQNRDSISYLIKTFTDEDGEDRAKIVVPRDAVLENGTVNEFQLEVFGSRLGILQCYPI